MQPAPSRWRRTGTSVRGADGVVCGHSHRAVMRMIEGTLYCNDGGGLKCPSAFVNHVDGRLEPMHSRGEPGAPPRQGRTAAARERAPDRGWDMVCDPSIGHLEPARPQTGHHATLVPRRSTWAVTRVIDSSQTGHILCA